MKNNPELLDDYISSPITVVDVGSDGGVHEIEGLAPYCSVHAFEPRQKSYEALVNGNKSLVVYDGKNYGNISYHNYQMEHHIELRLIQNIFLPSLLPYYFLLSNV